MKTIARVFVMLFFSIVIFGLSSCKKDEDETNNNEINYLSIIHQNGYSLDYAWVILHNPDGTQVLDYKKIVGDGVADFGEIGDGLVTTTTIRVDTGNAKEGIKRTYLIASDYGSPVGNWIFDGGNYSEDLLGEADINLSYQNINFDEYIVSTSNDWFVDTEVPVGELNINDDVRFLNDGNKYSIYGAVIDETGGYCNWLLDQDFQLDQTNYYYIDLNKALYPEYFSSSMPLHNYYFYGYWNNRESNLVLYRKSYWNIAPNGETNHKFYLPDNMPFTSYYGSGSYYGDNYSFSYSIFMDELIQGFFAEIPDHTISANYNESTYEISNIQVNGTIDQIWGSWDYSEFSDSTDIFIYWVVYANWDFTSIKRPVLPQGIINDIGEGINLMECRRVGLSDYNTASSHADIFTRFFINNVPFAQRFDERFHYSYYFNQDNKHCFYQKALDRNKPNNR